MEITLKKKTGEEYKIILDKQRGIDISRKAVKMLQDKKPPFDKPEVIPEMILPTGVGFGSLEQALFLFYAVGMDSSRNAADLYKGVREMVWEAKDVKKILAMDEDELSNLFDNVMGLGESRTGGHDTPVKTLLQNNKMLIGEYGADPRNICKATNDPDEIIERIRKFEQYGFGKAALLLKNYVKIGFAQLKDPFDYPIKVDRHVLRMSLGTGVLTIVPEGTYRTERLIPYLRKLYREICREERINPAELDDSQWVIGSKICVKRRLSYCQTMECPLECRIHAKMDKKGSYIYTTKNRREEIPSLFKNE
jgi:hypothetical protein